MFLHGGEGVLVSLLLLRRALIPLWGPHTLTASKTNYLPKGPASKYHHTGGQGFNAGILGGCNSVHSILLLPPHSCLSHIQKYIHCIPTAWKLWTVLASILKSNLLFKYHLKQEPGAAPPHTARRLHLELRCLARRFCSWCELLAQPYYMKNSGLKGGVKAFARSTVWASKTRLCTKEKRWWIQDQDQLWWRLKVTTKLKKNMLLKIVADLNPRIQGGWSKKILHKLKPTTGD